jgi:hypothetical protein
MGLGHIGPALANDIDGDIAIHNKQGQGADSKRVMAKHNVVIHSDAT